MIHSDGAGMPLCIRRPAAAACRRPPTPSPKRLHYVHQEGAAVYKFAVARMAEIAGELMARNGLTTTWSTGWCRTKPTGASSRHGRAYEAADGARYDGDPQIRQHDRGDDPAFLWDYEARLKEGDRLILAAFGGGFTGAGAYLRWAYAGIADAAMRVTFRREIGV